MFSRLWKPWKSTRYQCLKNLKNCGWQLWTKAKETISKTFLRSYRESANIMEKYEKKRLRFKSEIYVARCPGFRLCHRFVTFSDDFLFSCYKYKHFSTRNLPCSNNWPPFRHYDLYIITFFSRKAPFSEVHDESDVCNLLY